MILNSPLYIHRSKTPGRKPAGSNLTTDPLRRDHLPAPRAGF